MDSCRTWHTGELAERVSGRIVSLAHLPKGIPARVLEIASDAGAAITIGDAAHSTVARRLMEFGFVPGEQVEVIRHVWPGADPIAVRVGSSLFALRRREAEAVWVSLEDPSNLGGA